MLDKYFDLRRPSYRLYVQSALGHSSGTPAQPLESWIFLQRCAALDCDLKSSEMNK